MTTRSHDHGAVCRCVTEHRPPVLEYEVHHVWPKEYGGPDREENRVWICPTTHANTHELLRLMMKAGRELTDTELIAIEDRPVSRYAAGLARLGWRRITAQAVVS